MYSSVTSLLLGIQNGTSITCSFSMVNCRLYCNCKILPRSTLFCPLVCCRLYYRQRFLKKESTKCIQVRHYSTKSLAFRPTGVPSICLYATPLYIQYVVYNIECTNSINFDCSRLQLDIWSLCSIILNCISCR